MAMRRGNQARNRNTPYGRPEAQPEAEDNGGSVLGSLWATTKATIKWGASFIQGMLAPVPIPRHGRVGDPAHGHVRARPALFAGERQEEEEEEAAVPAIVPATVPVTPAAAVPAPAPAPAALVAPVLAPTRLAPAPATSAASSGAGAAEPPLSVVKPRPLRGDGEASIVAAAPAPVQTATDIVRLFMRADKRQARPSSSSPASALPAAFRGLDTPIDVSSAGDATSTALAVREEAPIATAPPEMLSPPVGDAISAFRPPPRAYRPKAANALALPPAASTLPALGTSQPAPRFNLCSPTPAAASAASALFGVAALPSTVAAPAKDAVGFGAPLLTSPPGGLDRPFNTTRFAFGAPKSASKRPRDSGAPTTDGLLLSLAGGFPAPAATIGTSLVPSSAADSEQPPPAKSARRYSAGAGALELGSVARGPVVTSAASSQAAQRILRTLELLDQPLNPPKPAPAPATRPTPLNAGLMGPAALPVGPPAADLGANFGKPPSTSCVDLTPAPFGRPPAAASSASSAAMLFGATASGAPPPHTAFGKSPATSGFGGAPLATDAKPPVSGFGAPAIPTSTALPSAAVGTTPTALSAKDTPAAPRSGTGKYTFGGKSVASSKALAGSPALLTSPIIYTFGKTVSKTAGAADDAAAPAPSPAPAPAPSAGGFGGFILPTTAPAAAPTMPMVPVVASATAYVPPT